MSVWIAVGSLGSLGAAAVAAVAAWQSKVAANEANSAAQAMVKIERERRHSELQPRFRLTLEELNQGPDVLLLCLTLIGPSGLDQLDRLTLVIRDDHHGRSANITQQIGTVTAADIEKQVWGPYRFSPGVGPGAARADETGRTTVCSETLPVGEGLPFQLQRTSAPPWDTGNTWKERNGTVVRVSLQAAHNTHGTWTIPCEINAAEPGRPIEV